MRKLIKERFEAPRDWDFEKMVEEYGMEYLQEEEIDPDVIPYPMDEFNELTNYRNNPLEALTRAFYGGRYGFKNDSFSPMDEFFAYNAYGNLISIGEYYLTEYLTDNIVEPYFYGWCVDNGYFESEEDE